MLGGKTEFNISMASQGENVVVEEDSLASNQDRTLNAF